MNQKSTWVQNPTKQQFLLSIFIYIIGVAFSVFSMSNLAEENFNLKKFDFKFNFLFFWLLIFTTVTMGKITKNYLANSHKK